MRFSWRNGYEECFFFLIWFIEHAPLLVVVLHAFSRAMYIDFTRSDRQSLLIQLTQRIASCTWL